MENIGWCLGDKNSEKCEAREPIGTIRLLELSSSLSIISNSPTSTISSWEWRWIGLHISSIDLVDFDFWPSPISFYLIWELSKRFWLCFFISISILIYLFLPFSFIFSVNIFFLLFLSINLSLHPNTLICLEIIDMKKWEKWTELNFGRSESASRAVQSKEEEVHLHSQD